MYYYTVPKAKHLRVIVDTDCKNEADDQFALTHHLMTPRFDIMAINAAHFEVRHHDGTSMGKSYDEIMKILKLTGNEGKYRVLHGSQYPLQYDPEERTNDDYLISHSSAFTPKVSWQENEASRFLIEEALREDPRPLFVVCLGALTNVATALLMNPEIAGRFTCVWIGGGAYPRGTWEFNLLQDVPAANIVFGSKLDLWQIPAPVYSQIKISLAELQVRVRPHGEIGRYLFEQLVALNDEYGENQTWPAGEMWCLGDQPTVTVLLEANPYDYDVIPAPLFTRDLNYIACETNRPIRVFHHVDPRLTLEDFFAKLEINFLAEKAPDRA